MGCMNFWENVEFELEKQGRYKKELAEAVGINASNFDKGKARNSIPSADKALRIAEFLGVPLENLLGLRRSAPPQKTDGRHCICELEKTLSNLSEEDAAHLLYLAKRLEQKNQKNYF